MKTWWLLHLESHVSHLPVCWGMRRNSEGQGPGRGPDTALRTSVCLSSWTTDSLKVESWELAPTALAPDERFEFHHWPGRVRKNLNQTMVEIAYFGEDTFDDVRKSSLLTFTQARYRELSKNASDDLQAALDLAYKAQYGKKPPAK